MAKELAPFQVPGFNGISMAQLNHIIQYKLGMRPVPTTDGCLFLKTVHSKLFVCVAPGHMLIAGGMGSSITATQSELFSVECKTLINSADVIFLPVGFYPFHAYDLNPSGRSAKRDVIISKLFTGELKVRTRLIRHKHNLGFLAILEMDKGLINIVNCGLCKKIRRVANSARLGILKEVAKLLGKRPKDLSTRTELTSANFGIAYGCALPMLYYMEMTLKGGRDIHSFTDTETVMNYFHQIWSVMKVLKLEVALDKGAVAAYICESRPVLAQQNQVKIEGKEENEENLAQHQIVQNEDEYSTGAISKVEEIMGICNNFGPDGVGSREVNCVYSIYKTTYF